jgi:hypothetical protein
LFGARGLATTVNVFNSFGAYIYFNASNSYYNVIGKSTSSSGSTVDPVYNKKILVKMDINNCSWTNFETGKLIRNNSFGYNGQLTRSESNMYIFDINSGNSTYADSPSYVKMYSFKIYDGNNNLRLDMIPVRVGTTGYMYDRVSGRLFGNLGTGGFGIGNDIT